MRVEEYCRLAGGWLSSVELLEADWGMIKRVCSGLTVQVAEGSC